MEPVATPSEMAAADRRTIAAGTPVETLMDRAGRSVAWAVRRRFDGAYGRRAVVVCGKGNNGGDGLIAARVLAGWGVRVDVVRLNDPPDASELDRMIARADVLVDAMYGTGFSGALDGPAAAIAARTPDLPTVAVDIPSGVDGQTGATTGPAVDAVATVTFAARKPGLLFEPGRSHAGSVHVADIGIDPGPVTLGLTDARDIRAWLLEHRRPPETNKWQAGVLVVGGSGGMTGAPHLVSGAALRAGAGIVWCGVPGHDAAARAGGAEIITKALPATADEALAGLGDLLSSVERFRAVAVGPGLGTAEPTRAAVRELVATATRPLVLDADGLNAFAGEAATLRERPGPTVLTPHDGEYARLAGEPVGADRVDSARRLAAVTGAVVLLKGPTTVIAEPDGRAFLNLAGGPELATAGSGDVLTGIIAGLLARGFPAVTAAAAGAFIHGRAGDRSGHTGLIASDLIAALPRTLTDLTTTPGSRNAHVHPRP
ncbi:MAG TPA: NAD(P)H-hydrate dehydratase [Acidimicrobiia bacterium]|nr:NAD(P)H-hydrate dehydratase [Acidimicrobiia bacterium]